MKVIRTKMPDGSVWDVPLSKVVELLFEEAGSDHGLSDVELIQHARYDIVWDKLSTFARRVTEPPALTTKNQQTGWSNGVKVVVEVEDPKVLATSPICGTNGDRVLGATIATSGVGEFEVDLALRHTGDGIVLRRKVEIVNAAKKVVDLHFDEPYLPTSWDERMFFQIDGVSDTSFIMMNPNVPAGRRPPQGG